MPMRRSGPTPLITGETRLHGGVVFPSDLLQRRTVGSAHNASRAERASPPSAIRMPFTKKLTSLLQSQVVTPLEKESRYATRQLP